MKLFALLALALAFTSTQAYALDVQCEYGTIGNDNYQNVSINKDGLNFGEHEMHLDAPAKYVVTSGNTFAVLEKKLKGSVEGDSFTAVTSALVVYNPKSKKALVTLVMDGFTQIQTEMKCR